MTDGFLESIRLGNKLSKMCDLYRKEIKLYQELVKLLKKSRKDSTEILRYAQIQDEIHEIELELKKVL